MYVVPPTVSLPILVTTRAMVTWRLKPHVNQVITVPVAPLPRLHVNQENTVIPLALEFQFLVKLVSTVRIQP